MKMQRMFGRTIVGVLVFGLGLPGGCLFVKGAETESVAEPVLRSQAGVDADAEGTRLTRLLKEASLSPGVSEVAKLAQLGSSESVLTAHVRSSERAYRLRPEDIAYLQAQKVPDAVVTAMIERGAELRAQRPPAAPTVAPVVWPTPPTAVAVQVEPEWRSRPPESTLIVIGSSSLQRGLSYRNYYYSPRKFFSSRPYGGLYASFGNYARPYPGPYPHHSRGRYACY
jgi:hypothetical protein